MLLQVNKGVALSLHFLYARNVCGMLATRFASARRHFIPLVCRLCFIKRTMSNGTHLERTTDKPRGRVFSRAVVREILQLSPSVTGFTLKVTNPELKFIAGQWVDVHIPGVDVVGGYSMTSPPHQLDDPSIKTIELAVKHSPHPPAEWMTTNCSVGDEVDIQVGGDFCYSPSLGKGLPDLILIGGGVGINPLFSMLLHHVQIMTDHSTADGRGSVHLLYSSKTENELVFKDKLQEIALANSNVHVQFFVTSEQARATEAVTKGGRIRESDLLTVLSNTERENVQAYICGPPPMIDTMVDVLTNNGQCKLSSEQIHFERWW